MSQEQGLGASSQSEDRAATPSEPSQSSVVSGTAGIPCAETFTDRCRRMLTEQPKQLEFTLSRVGLETLVLDSERYGELNARLVAENLRAAEHAAEQAERWRYKSIDEQIADLRQKWPDTTIGDATDQYGQRLLRVPGVRRVARVWKNDAATVCLLIPSEFPTAQPHRFFTSDDDTLLEHGGQTANVIRAVCNPLVEGMWEWLWRIREPSARHTLREHITVAQHRFQIEGEQDLAA